MNQDYVWSQILLSNSSGNGVTTAPRWPWTWQPADLGVCQNMQKSAQKTCYSTKAHHIESHPDLTKAQTSWVLRCSAWFSVKRSNTIWTLFIRFYKYLKVHKIQYSNDFMELSTGLVMHCGERGCSWLMSMAKCEEMWRDVKRCEEMWRVFRNIPNSGSGHWILAQLVRLVRLCLLCDGLNLCNLNSKCRMLCRNL